MADELEFRCKTMVIKIKKSLTNNSTYDAVRYAWKIDPRRARVAELVLAVSANEIIGVFVPHEWLPATKDNFPGRWKPNDRSSGRFGFVGVAASNEVASPYLGKRLPVRFTVKGAAAPVWYTY